MCGISGFYSHRKFFSQADLEKMTAVLVHRRPDARGFFSDETVGLGHTETRVPYLDHRIVEFALNLSPALKFRNGTSKYLLKKSALPVYSGKLLSTQKTGLCNSTQPLANLRLKIFN